MVPPPKGTRAYATYLQKQRRRRQAERAQAKAKRAELSAQPYADKALAETRRELLHWRKTADGLLLKSNRYYRDLGTAKAKVKELTAATAHLRALLLAAREETAAAQALLKKTEGRLDSWQTWWGRLRSKAPLHLLRRLRELTQPPTAAPSWTYQESGL